LPFEIGIGPYITRPVRSMAARTLAASRPSTQEGVMVIPLQLDVDLLHRAIQEEYAKVAVCPMQGFHFHTGRSLAARLGYPAPRVDALSESAVESFAGVGNPFSWG